MRFPCPDGIQAGSVVLFQLFLSFRAESLPDFRPYSRRPVSPAVSPHVQRCSGVMRVYNLELSPEVYFIEGLCPRKLRRHWCINGMSKK